MGSELTTEPFRWDQRLFSLVLRFPGHHPSHSLLQQPQPTSSTDESPIQTMCAMMGGIKYFLWQSLYDFFRTIVLYKFS